MKIALISPQTASSASIAISRQPGTFPTGLGYIAAYLRRAGHDALIFAPDVTRTDMKLIWKELEDFRPDIVGVTSVTVNFTEARRVVTEAKGRFGCLVVMGGPHVNALARSTLESLPALDAVILGEGELPMLAMAEELGRSGTVDLAGVPGAAFIRDGQFRQTPPHDPIADLDDLPYPARDLLSGGAWRGYTGQSRPISRATLISSRGCPSKCTFCANNRVGRRFRARTPLNVVEELEFLKEKYGTRNFTFSDDCFTADTKRAYEICSLIIEKELNITWDASARVNTLTDEALIVRMKKAGCIGITIGVETSSQRLSDLMKKGTTPAQAELCCALLRRHGIPCSGGFILGCEGETLKTALDTIAFASKLKLTLAFFNITIPLPGTELFDKFYKEFDRPDTDWSDWTSQGISRPYEPRQTALSGRTLWLLMLWAHLRFYGNPFQILRILLYSMSI